MGDNKKLLNLHEQKFAELEASNTNSQILQKTTNASLKNLETQIGQLALNLQNQMKDAFPSDTKKNPKDCMAVQLRSGKELEEKTEKDESNKGEEGTAVKRRRKQEEDPEQFACSPISTEAAELKNRRTICKVLKDISEAGDQHAFHRSDYTDATLCKIFERYTEQKEEDC